MGAESGESQPAEARENTNYQGVNDSVCHSIGWRDTASFLHQSGRMVGKLVWVNNESESIEWIGDFSCEVLITSLRIAGGFVWAEGRWGACKAARGTKDKQKKIVCYACNTYATRCATQTNIYDRVFSNNSNYVSYIKRQEQFKKFVTADTIAH